MNENNFIISDKQCYQIASNIYLDVADYIKQHQDEFNTWLKETKGGKE